MVTKTFSTIVVASTATGISLSDGISFSLIHEVCEFVAGHPVWTHELGDREMMSRVQEAIRAQLPNLPTEKEARADYASAANVAAAAYGPTVTLTQGTMVRTESPMSSLKRMMGRP